MSVQINPTVEKQPIAVIDQADPTLDKYYLVATSALGEIDFLSLEQTNDEADVKDIEILVTLDGTEYSGRIAAGVSGTRYYAYRSPVEDALILTTSIVNSGYYIAIRGHVITVEAAIHTANGTNQVLECDVQYGEAPEGTYWWYKHYPTAILDQVPVEDTDYTILDTVNDARVLFLNLKQTHDEAGGEDLRCIVTIDGVALLDTTTFVNNTVRYFYLTPFSDGLNVSSSLYNACYYDALDGQSVKVEMRQTTAIGTNPLLYGRVVYELYEEVA